MSKYTLIKFTAEWCGPCKKIEPDLKALAKRYEDLVSFKTVDVDQDEKTADEWQVTALPTLLLVNNEDQKEMFRSVGVNLSKLNSKLNVLK